MDSFEIALPNSKQSLVLCGDVLKTFLEARQTAPGDKETGGILLAEISNKEVRIVNATRAEKPASVSRFLFKPSLRKKRLVVKEAFEAGLHFAGEWHTHPEKNPTPSSIDEESMKDSFKRSKHELNSFIMVIVGNCEEDLSLSVTLHSKGAMLPLGKYKIERE